MKNKFLSLILLSFFIVGCSTPSSAPATIVQNYYQALINKNLNGMLATVCSNWEEQARNDYQSFAAVSAQLKNLQCQVQAQQDNDAAVICQGKIEANYGNEILEIDLSKFLFKVIQENGEWRLCGYQ